LHLTRGVRTATEAMLRRASSAWATEMIIAVW
jgi:hypothetical protein